MKNTFNVLIAILLSSQLHAQSGQKNFIDQPYIEVTGQVETEIIPNEIYLKIVLNENDKKGRISIEKQENQMISILKKLNIDLDKNLSILDFDGFYKRKFFGNNQVAKKKIYQLIINDGKTLGQVYMRLDDIDISNISIQKVDHTNMDNLKRQNKIKAITQAKSKASDYAIVLDQNIGKAIYIQEIQQYNNYRYNTNALDEVIVSAYSKSKDEEISDLKFKPITLKSSIIARFILN